MEPNAVVRESGLIVPVHAQQVRVEDKRGQGVKVNPIDHLLADTLNFVLQHPSYPQVLSLSRPDRKKLEKAIAKMLTRVPHFQPPAPEPADEKA